MKRPLEARKMRILKPSSFMKDTRDLFLSGAKRRLVTRTQYTGGFVTDFARDWCKWLFETLLLQDPRLRIRNSQSRIDCCAQKSLSLLIFDVFAETESNNLFLLDSTVTVC